jgi:hypothetical protein
MPREYALNNPLLSKLFFQQIRQDRYVPNRKTVTKPALIHPLDIDVKIALTKIRSSVELVQNSKSSSNTEAEVTMPIFAALANVNWELLDGNA